MGMNGKMGRWGGLPHELLLLVAGRLAGVDDFVRFGAVCRAWRGAMVEKKNKYKEDDEPSAFLPWLMLGRKGINLLLFLNLSDHKIHGFPLPLLPDTSASVPRIGSSHGWLALIPEYPKYGTHITLFNPFSDAQIHLPHFREDLDNLHQKIVLSSSPTSGGPFAAVVATFYINPETRLFFLPPGTSSDATTWTTVRTSFNTTLFQDFVYYKEKFVAINWDGRVVAFDFRGGANPPVETEIGKIPGNLDKVGILDSLYLVELEGELLGVVKYMGLVGSHPTRFCSYKTDRFEVFKLDQSGPDTRWVEVKSLGHHSLFLGLSASISLRVESASGFSKNCIYFTMVHNAGELGGVYSLEDASVTPLVSPDFSLGTYHFPPIWVTPKIW